eukprot:365130-Chlamydomonas_euryale.AAC.25
MAPHGLRARCSPKGFFAGADACASYRRCRRSFVLATGSSCLGSATASARCDAPASSSGAAAVRLRGRDGLHARNHARVTASDAGGGGVGREGGGGRGESATVSDAAAAVKPFGRRDLLWGAWRGGPPGHSGGQRPTRRAATRERGRSRARRNERRVELRRDWPQVVQCRAGRTKARTGWIGGILSLRDGARCQWRAPGDGMASSTTPKRKSVFPYLRNPSQEINQDGRAGGPKPERKRVWETSQSLTREASSSPATSRGEKASHRNAPHLWLGIAGRVRWRGRPF